MKHRDCRKWVTLNVPPTLKLLEMTYGPQIKITLISKEIFLNDPECFGFWVARFRGIFKNVNIVLLCVYIYKKILQSYNSSVQNAMSHIFF